MKRYLTDHEIEYVIFHLGFHIENIENYRPWFALLKKDLSISNSEPRIYFNCSEQEIDLTFRVLVHEKEIPVFFPIRTDQSLYYVDHSNNLVFSHDFLKSAFYLLSGYQETQPFQPDWMGRFPYTSSIQYKTGSVHLPLVNYYFEIIACGIEKFCLLHSIPFQRKRLFDQFGFVLSHDVDRISFYHPKEVLFKIKQLIGLAPLYYSKSLTFQLFLKGLLFNLNPFRGRDPWWNFDQMTALEKKLGIRSTFFFLEKEHRNKDSRYTFQSGKIKQLIKMLNSEGFEVGIHGTIQSAESGESLNKQLASMQENTGISPAGIRQHFLRFFHPRTFRHHIAAGFQYDTSLAFAEHEGFRNGYCYPFKPYDFDNDQMMDIWEIPLVMMEVSVLGYQELPYHCISEKSIQLISEIKKFGGIFTLLWHNCRLDEFQYPGINQFYCEYLKMITDMNCHSINNYTLIKMINSPSRFNFPQ